jgi:hypothetical protein
LHVDFKLNATLCEMRKMQPVMQIGGKIYYTTCCLTVKCIFLNPVNADDLFVQETVQKTVKSQCNYNESLRCFN